MAGAVAGLRAGRGGAAVFGEEAHQVSKLAMQVAEDFDGRRQL